MFKGAFFLFSFFSLLNISAQTNKQVLEALLKSRTVALPNGWSLSPAGQSLQLGDLPLNIAVSHSGKYLAVTNNGVGTQAIQLISTQNNKQLFNMPIAESWLGLKFSKNEKYLYASGGNNNAVLIYSVANDSLALSDSIILGKRWPEKISPAGIEIDERKHRLYTVTKENNSLYITDIVNRKVIKQINLSAEAYTCILSPNKPILFISLWGGGKVLFFDTEKELITDSIITGQNPNDLCLTRNGKFLFVANALDNSVSVIDVAKRKPIQTLNATLYPDALQGATTNSVCLSNDDRTLYIANADNNCLAVFDVSVPANCKSKGFIPTGWYPTSVRVIGKTIYVANGKGFSSLPNPNGPQPIKKEVRSAYKNADDKDEYIGKLFKGTLSIIAEPDKDALAVYSKAVYNNTPYNKTKEVNVEGQIDNPIPLKPGNPSPITHVFYIIKENRTYDQVMGDEPGGNGDTALVLFGKRITPNQHALAEQFVLLDNFYVDAEVSADGHNWSMAAYANDYIEKTWPTSYGGRGGTYDYNGYRKIAFPRDGFIWDYAFRAGLTVRNYGEFRDDDDGSVPLKELNKHTCPLYPGWNLKIQDVFREKIWEKDFDSLSALNAVPQLNIIYLPNDHTSGLSKNAFTPYAHVADNDLALGKLVEHLSQSPEWKTSAVFVLEDDAQNGPDHVDAHRSIAFMAGPFVKRHYIDHTMYSTSGMLRTIELILGLPPMSQYDAGATPMYRSFALESDNTAYIHIDASIDINERNVAVNSDADETYNLAYADAAPDLKFNEALWKGLKGILPYPMPRRAAFVTVKK